MKFLENYDFSKEEIAEFLNNSPKKIIEAIKENKKLVGENMIIVILPPYFLNMSKKI